MDRPETISKTIRQFILDHFPLARQRHIGDCDSLLDNGIIDSMGVLEVVTFIEAQFRIGVSDEELVPENFQSVSCLADFVQSKLNGNLTSQFEKGSWIF
jgi:acyl carrier protein